MKTAMLLTFVLLTASFMGTTAAALYGQHAIDFDSTADMQYRSWRAAELTAFLTDTTRGAVYDSLMGALHERIFDDKFGPFAPPLVKQREDNHSLTSVAPISLDVQPNPTDGTTTFQWQTTIDGTVKITIIDRLGRLVATAFQGYSRAGIHSSVFDVSSMPNGIYYARLEAEGQTFVTQLGILR